MENNATLILVIAITLISNPYNPLLLICPFGFSVFFECLVRKFTISDNIIATSCIFLMFAGLIICMLGIGFTSPIFTTNVSSSTSINTKIAFNDQNLSTLKTSDNITIFNGIHTSNISILNISTTLKPQTTAFDFGMLGLFIGIVSLGFSIILSAISAILTIYKSYDAPPLNNEDYRKISIIWLIFGFIILLYGYLLSDLISSLIKLFGIIYIDFGLLLFLYYSWKIYSQRDLSQKIQLIITQLQVANQNMYHSRFSSGWFRDQINTFINNMKSMESLKIRAWVVISLSLVLIVYGGWAIFNPNLFLNYLPEVVILGIGLGALTWAIVTLYYSCNVTPPAPAAEELTTEH